VKEGQRGGIGDRGKEVGVGGKGEGMGGEKGREGIA